MIIAFNFKLNIFIFKINFHSNILLEEFQNVSKIPKILRVKNILDDEKNLGNIDEKTALINPCFGDPSNRTISSGSFMSEKAFLKPDNFYLPTILDVGFQRAGPRLHVALKPSETVLAISTSGGLCPGLNVVIRELVMSSWYNYGVRKIYGIKWGYEGAVDVSNWIELNPNIVKDIHREGGTILGTCRCELNAKAIADNLIANKVNVYFSVGGDGTHKG